MFAGPNGKLWTSDSSTKKFLLPFLIKKSFLLRVFFIPLNIVHASIFVVMAHIKLSFVMYSQRRKAWKNDYC